MGRIDIYREIEISEKQIIAGQTKDARSAYTRCSGQIWDNSYGKI